MFLLLPPAAADVSGGTSSSSFPVHVRILRGAKEEGAASMYEHYACARAEASNEPRGGPTDDDCHPGILFSQVNECRVTQKNDENI